MKKRAIAVVIIWALFLCFVWQFRTESYADPFTASQIGSVAYAMFNSWGVSFSSGAATSAGMNDFMSSQVEDYVNSQGGSIADVFVGQIAVDVAGKLVVGQQMYNSMIGFLDWMKQKFNLGSTDTTLQDGVFENLVLPQASEASELLGVGYEFIKSNWYEPSETRIGGWMQMSCYYNGVLKTSSMCTPSIYFFTGRYSVTVEKDSSGRSFLVAYYEGIRNNGQPYGPIRERIVEITTTLTNSISWNGTNFVQPTVLNPDKQWTGTIDGYSEPDTNLEDLLGGIDDAIADNNLDVEGEIVDVPVPPTPQPEPIDPDTPLQDVPWEGLNDLIDNSTESVTESIGEAASDITGAIEGTQEAVESLEETITESLDVPAASEITGRKFDLSTLFPFCIPFDIYRMMQAFDGTPEAPHVQLPFVIQSIGFSYTFDLDFSAFDSVAAIMRTVEFIAFGIFLAFSTSKVIRW